MSDRGGSHQPTLTRTQIAYGAGTVIGGALLLQTVRFFTRNPPKFERSLTLAARNRIAGLPFMPRQAPFSLNQRQAVILKAPPNSGQSALIAHAVKQQHPFMRMVDPPRGLVLNGDDALAEKSGVDVWLRTQIDNCKPHRAPVATLLDDVRKHAYQQRVRLFLHARFPRILHRALQPLPSLVVVDSAELPLMKYRAEFLLAMSPLVAHCNRCPDELQLVFVVHSDEAVESLKALGQHNFRVIDAPKPEVADVRAAMGDDFARTFEQLDRRVGLTLSFMSRDGNGKKMTAAELLEEARTGLWESTFLVSKAVTWEEITPFVTQRREVAITRV